MTITQELKNATINGSITIEKALKIAAEFDKEREQSTKLLTTCLSWVGMTLGAEINTHLASIKGENFNERDYHFERLPGEQ